MIRLATLASALVLAATGGCASIDVARAGTTASTAEAASLATARRVADWQLDHMEVFDYVGSFQRQTADGRDWIQAAFFIGLTDLADAPGGERYAAVLERHGEREAWSYGARPRHADADAIGQAWIWAAGRAEGDVRSHRLAATVSRFDTVLAAPSDASMIFDEGPGERPCQVRWCWSDALFMAPPAWAELSALTGDDRYLAHADREFRATVDALFDRDEKLFYRDSRFIGRPGPSGHKVFWSRGNGWSYAGIARMLEVMPAGDPRRAYYESLFREMSARIVTLQGAEGYWPVSLLDAGGPPETSGTAFFVYGLAWGINHGLLSAAEYGPSVQRGWAGLERAVQPDGRLGWVQQVGYAPDRVTASDTQLYGVGAFLLASVQVAKLPSGQAD
ncbi:MAG: glucuronyl hydrolase [Brevundimonas sp.]|nr:MAG: glucuronyl hydrolase [Brevundimonas sp.]